ncbi:hypothetical protein FC093_06210 [Ilyomonas limi]|uniref:Asparagine synthetase domain-containing protein n=1 Tax=Ilyomonas limi TaxID=2575867 RepID=A0A4U3L8U2_9BACT|nr:hypothetical protein [Ilyomonas limi]TKK70336.1 hypothetical protein FC093_06210 [Ilyomonas limi]
MENIFLYRRQFILSSQPEFCFDGWKNTKLDSTFYLSAHPDLEVTQSSFNETQLTLLGFFVDPFAPMKSNQEILNDIVKESSSFNDVVNKTESLGGRWIIIYYDQLSLRIFHDVCGQRQVYFYQNKDIIVCGSDPAIIRHFIELEKDESFAMQEYIIKSALIKDAENAWIGSGTIFCDVLHLMPNHYLDLKGIKAIRYWPHKPLEKIDLDRGTDLAAEILVGSLNAINNRSKLALAVTSGWDSRLLLAASKSISKDVTYFVSVSNNQSTQIPDALIPSKLFKQLNIPFYVQICDTEIEPTFEKILKTNVTLARPNLAKVRHIYKYHLDFNGMININGNITEITRTSIRPPFPVKVNGTTFTKMKYMKYYKGISYVVSQFDEWIHEISSFCSAYNLNIYDMLYWEQRMGNWGAHYPAELDIAMDQFSPFNNRLLLTIMLSVDEKYRRYPNFVLHHKIIQKLWPETLQQPVGKEDYKIRTRHLLKHAMMVLSGVY